VKDITVLTNNFPYGKWNHKYLRSGSNETTGKFSLLTDQGRQFDGKSSFAQRLIRNQVKNGFARYQTGVGIGGALVKDKTFYYFNFEHTTDIKEYLLLYRR
jgi:hypothetical protein